jgi:hypothetical protein
MAQFRLKSWHYVKKQVPRAHSVRAVKTQSLKSRKVSNGSVPRL